MRIVEELVEIWPNEVCDNPTLTERLKALKAYAGKKKKKGE